MWEGIEQMSRFVQQQIRRGRKWERDESQKICKGPIIKTNGYILFGSWLKHGEKNLDNDIYERIENVNTNWILIILINYCSLLWSYYCDHIIFTVILVVLIFKFMFWSSYRCNDMIPWICFEIIQGRRNGWEYGWSKIGHELIIFEDGWWVY